MIDNPILAGTDGFFERWSERFSPIVVKETRQAINSRSFPITFMVMLVACWIISTAGAVSYGDDLYFSETGPEFFSFYYGALLIALCIVVPISLFYSVVSEFDGHTFEVLAITTLTPRQVVFGKLKSASLQMGAFYAGVAPFICFTYMLEGVSIPGILLALFISYIAGLSACMGAMMLGSLAKQSGWQIVCLLLSLVLGAICFGFGLGSGMGVVSEAMGADMMGAFCCMGGGVSYVMVFFTLLTIGVSIAQFTPTMPRPGQLKRRRRKRKKSAPIAAASEVEDRPPES